MQPARWPTSLCGMTLPGIRPRPAGLISRLRARGDAAAADGRLTAEEVYGLDLHADLVFLSACRTALGRISGDGVAGLARAFFYAGAASVVSTLWDVADEPTSQLWSSSIGLS